MSKELSDLLVALTKLVESLNAALNAEGKSEVAAHVTAQLQQLAQTPQAKTEEPVRQFQLEERCPKCGRPLIRKFSVQKKNFFVGCAGYKSDKTGCPYSADWNANAYHMIDKAHQFDSPEQYAKDHPAPGSAPAVQFVDTHQANQSPFGGINWTASSNASPENPPTKYRSSVDGPF